MPSIKRNRLILDVLYRSKDVEKAGTGFQRVNEICNDNGITWDYRKEAYGFFFEFIRPTFYINKPINKKLNKQEEIVLNSIANDKNLSKIDIALRLNKSERTIQRIISSLITKGLIERKGTNKNGYWCVVK